MKICKVKGCENKILYKNGKYKNFCKKHYRQIERCGKILERTQRDKNEIIDCKNYCEIVLYNNKSEEVARAKIDKEDLKNAKKHKWHLDFYGYVISQINNKAIRLHQLVIGKKSSNQIDHINHNKFDNRKQNLRHCTTSQNCMNRKNVKGYCWNKENKKWQVQICINYKNIHIGCFKNKQDAITARRQAELKYFKEFAINIK